MIVPELGPNLFSSVRAITSGESTLDEAGNSHLQFNNNTSLPLYQRPADKGMCSYEVLLDAMGGTIETTPTIPQHYGGIRVRWTKPCDREPVHANNTPEEATAAETERQRAQIPDSTPADDTATKMEHQRVHIQDRPQRYASSLLEEDEA